MGMDTVRNKLSGLKGKFAAAAAGIILLPGIWAGVEATYTSIFDNDASGYKNVAHEFGKQVGDNYSKAANGTADVAKWTFRKLQDIEDGLTGPN